MVNLASRLSEIQLKEVPLVEIHIQYIFIRASHLKQMKYLCRNDFSFPFLFTSDPILFKDWF